MKNLNENLSKLIKMLNDGKFHSGSEMGEQLEITRSAVWKMIHQLEKLGIALYSVKGKGYRFAKPLQLLDSKQIKKHILDPDTRKKCKIDLFSTIDSTSLYLKEKKIPKDCLTYICLSEQQSAGRGRLSRNWHSPFADNIYFSGLFQFNKDISELAGLSLVISLVVLKTLADLGIEDGLKIKWPNDILWQGKKLSGILIDISAESHGISRAIISVGLNVNMSADQTKFISQPWTSLSQMMLTHFDRNIIVGLLINNLVDYLKKFNNHGLEYFHKEWQRHDYLADQTISVTNNKHIVSGTMMGINNKGHLLLKHADGKVTAYSSGDTTINKS